MELEDINNPLEGKARDSYYHGTNRIQMCVPTHTEGESRSESNSVSPPSPPPPCPRSSQPLTPTTTTTHHAALHTTQTINMNISPLSTILLAALPAAYTNALSCQSKFATPCRAESDKRYDPNASADLIQQNPIWEGTEGFWVQPVTASFDIAGQPLQPTWFYEGGVKGMPGYGIPYKQSTSTSFINRTIVGSRMFMHIYSIFEPADAEFCAKDVPVGAANVIGEGSCGGTGFVMSSDQIGTSTFERDGTLHTFFTAIGLPYDYSGVSIPNSIATPIGSDTIVYQAGVPGGISLAYTEVSANIENTVIGGSSSDINMVPSKDPNDPNISHTIYNGTKVEESEWVSSLLAAYDAAKVPVEEREQFQ